MSNFFSDEMTLYGYSLFFLVVLFVVPFVLLIRKMMYPEESKTKTMMGLILVGLMLCGLGVGIVSNYVLWASEFDDVILSVENSTRKGKATFKLVENGRMRIFEKDIQNCTAGSNIHKKPKSFAFVCTSTK